MKLNDNFDRLTYILTLLKTKDKCKILKATRRKRKIKYYKGRKVNMTTYFSSETNKSEDNERHI